MPEIHRRHRTGSYSDEDDHVNVAPPTIRPVTHGIFRSCSSYKQCLAIVQERFRQLHSCRIGQRIRLLSLIYAYFGLPVFGRILNVVRYGRRFTLRTMLQGIVAGFLQDVAIFCQAGTLVVLTKLLIQYSFQPHRPHASHHRNDDYPASLEHQLATVSRVRKPSADYHSTTSSDSTAEDTDFETAELLGSRSSNVAIAPLSSTSTPTIQSMFMHSMAKGCLHAVAWILLFAISLFSTVFSVADFCLLVTLHPGVNRAFVEIFFNHIAQFTASLFDDEVLTPTVVTFWLVYIILILVLTHAYVHHTIPLLPEILGLTSHRLARRSSSNCLNKRKNSSTLPHISTDEETLPQEMSLYETYWSGAQQRRSSRRSTFTLPPSAICADCTKSTVDRSYPSVFTAPKQVARVISRCVLVSCILSVGALLVSFAAWTYDSDMKLMSNAVYMLQVEPLFARDTGLELDTINCTSASTTLLSTLSRNEKYSVDAYGNDDRCALLWRKTTDVSGETWFDLDWKQSSEHASNDTTDAVEAKPPNILVLNMESWRSLDVGVLGGASTKASTGQSATPRFDALSQDGVLYTKHYTQCVQTTRTLLTMLFGMLPSCTETTALKTYGTSLNVQGLPHFLKDKGYYNLFWSAVDLRWEYWDEFLLMNGFDALVGDTRLREMLHQSRNYVDTSDDHFSWGIHDHLSFEMLLHTIESAANTSDAADREDGWQKELGQMQAPYFIDMYTITSHNPWALPDFYNPPDLSALYTRFNKRYIDAMRFSDEMLGDFIDELRRRGLMKNTIVIIQGDHGYGRMEHDTNPSIADSAVYDEATHVPFLILADDYLKEEEKGMRVDQLSMQSDLMLTIADIVGVSPDDPLWQHGVGHSMKRKEQGRNVVLCNPFNGMTQGVRTEDQKYTFFDDKSYKVFQMDSDPLEKSPVEAGFDVDAMQDDTKAMHDFAQEQVQLHQFLYTSNKFVAEYPLAGKSVPPSTNRSDDVSRLRKHQ